MELGNSMAWIAAAGSALALVIDFLTIQERIRTKLPEILQGSHTPLAKIRGGIRVGLFVLLLGSLTMGYYQRDKRSAPVVVVVPPPPAPQPSPSAIEVEHPKNGNKVSVPVPAWMRR